MSKQFIRCKYCAYTIMRFGKKRKYQGKKLMLHIVEEHTDKFLMDIGFNGSLMQYLDMRDSEDDWIT